MKLASNCGAKKNPPTGPEDDCIAALPAEFTLNESKPA